MATELRTGVDARPVGAAPLDVRRVQRRTLLLLCLTQVIGGTGMTIGMTVGVLLGARLGGTAVSGLVQSASVVGGALLALPVSRIMRTGGRRSGLAVAYLAGALGGVLIVVAAMLEWVPLLFVGAVFFGGGTTAGLQARYAAVDLAEPTRRGRHLSIAVWATTIGAVTAPNLAAPADRALAWTGVPVLAGPFVFSVLAFVLAAGVLLVFLRPDPLLTARRLAAAGANGAAATGTPVDGAGTTATAADGVPGGGVPSSGAPGGGVPGSGVSGAGAPGSGAPASGAPGKGARAGRDEGLRGALRVVRDLPAARLGISAVAMGHLVMVGVMVMTPVRLGEWHSDAHLLRVVGLVLSLHIAGMFALAPVVGWLTDRVGRRAVILGGLGLLLVACAVAGTAGHDTVRISIGLTLLGLGWSGTMVAGSTLLSESVPVEVRPSVQGLSDLTMGLAGALAGALSGFVIQVAGYPVLNLLAAVAVVPLLALALRTALPRVRADG
ncbi:MFS transporter [Micromonospora sp. WMMD1102]|uniref:MFS transporter n=1 Tax=Micromonospora sp. WMMD1102 TaxID=3016105 RepID=UPI002415796D|nr:MFS transporter [Micromonospora sp. WMMD1102]MDG4785768.1 MFS transporter [Micromonospora sp. WMMD1102]